MADLSISSDDISSGVGVVTAHTPKGQIWVVSCTDADVTKAEDGSERFPVFVSFLRDFLWHALTEGLTVRVNDKECSYNDGVLIITRKPPKP